MGHQPQVGRGVLVAEGGDGGCHVHHAGNDGACLVAELPAACHHVAAVLHDAHVYVESRPRLACGDLGSEGDGEAHPCGHVSHHPFGHHELVGALLGLHGQKLYLALLIDAAVLAEIAHLRVAVLDLSAGTRDVVHATGAEVHRLGERSRLVVSALVGGGEGSVVRHHHIVFQFAHGVERHARHLCEDACGLAQRVLGRTLEGQTVPGEKRGQQAQCGHLGEGVDEGRAEARHHIEVAAAGADEGEEAGTVDTLATGEHGVEIGKAVDGEAERLEFAVAAGIHEVDHPYAIVAYVADDVGLGEVAGRFLQVRHHLVGVEREFVDVHSKGCLEVFRFMPYLLQI